MLVVMDASFKGRSLITFGMAIAVICLSQPFSLGEDKESFTTGCCVSPTNPATPSMDIFCPVGFSAKAVLSLLEISVTED